VSDFSQALEPLRGVARPARLREVAPSLLPPLERAGALSARLSSQRLADSRLEAQRARAAAALATVVDAMDATTDAASDGNPARMESAADALRRAVGELREVQAQ
jgi:hypothetical protein